MGDFEHLEEFLRELALGPYAEFGIEEDSFHGQFVALVQFASFEQLILLEHVVLSVDLRERQFFLWLLVALLELQICIAEIIRIIS